MTPRAQEGGKKEREHRGAGRRRDNEADNNLCFLQTEVKESTKTSIYKEGIRDCGV